MKERNNATQHNTRPNTSRQDKTRQEKTSKTKLTLPLSPPSTPLPRARQTPIFMSFIHRHLYLPCLCSLCNAVTVHTHVTKPLHIFIRIEKHEERGNKNGDAKTRVEKASVLNGDSYHTFHFHHTSLLHSSYTRFPTTATPDARKCEERSMDKLTVYRSCVKLK